jgi:hypothetical protein
MKQYKSDITNELVNELFRSKLKDFEVPVDDAIWKGIEAELHPKRNNRKIIIWLSIVSVAACFAMLVVLQTSGLNDVNSNSTVISHYSTKTTNTKYATAKLKVVTPYPQKKSANTTSTRGQNNIQEECKPRLPIKNNEKATATTDSNTSALSISMVDKNHKQNDSVVNSKNGNDESLSTDKVLDNKPIAEQKHSKRKTQLEKIETDDDDTNSDETSTAKKDWSIGALLASNNSQNNVTQVIHTDNFTQGVKGPITDTPTQTTRIYSPPVSLGLIVQKELNKKVSLQTGIFLKIISSNTNDQNDLINQFYIGVPIELAINLWQFNNWSTYCSIGGTVEQGIVYTERLSGNTTNNLSTSSYMGTKAFQTSATGALGLDYKLSSQIHLYFEPKLCYYFYNNQPIGSFYQSQPLSLGISGGVKFKI